MRPEMKQFKIMSRLSPITLLQAFQRRFGSLLLTHVDAT